VPGTTRDSVDVRFERDGQAFLAIDTAGVRRAHSLASDVEFYSLARAERSIRRADVVLMFFDAKLRVSKVDKQLAEYILEQHKPAIFVLNKWDLMLPLPTGKMADYMRKTFPSLDFVPMAFITAKDGKNVQALLNLAQTMHKQASLRIGTGDLNRVLRAALEASPPPLRQNRRAKVFYGTQVGTNPPTIVLFTNGPELFDNTYQRYLIKTFRDQLGFSDVPIKMYLRNKVRDDSAEAPEDSETPKPSRKPVKARKGAKATAAPKGERPVRGKGSELWDV
jgi:GTP-binding protein